MIAIPCQNCSHMIDIDTQKEPIKVPLYLLLCKECQQEAKNNERNKKLNKVLSLFRDSHEVSRRGLVQRIKQWLE
jgi:DNA-directed RNA polymerase subunit M/transcription elongation factor TFIIS